MEVKRDEMRYNPPLKWDTIKQTLENLEFGLGDDEMDIVRKVKAILMNKRLDSKTGL